MGWNGLELPDKMSIPELSMLQEYANKVAKKLNITCQPIVRWLRESDECRELGSHCHAMDLNQKRGTICIPYPSYKQDCRGWQWIIAHEVCHLHGESCDSPYFAKLMMQLGFPQYIARV